MPKHADYFIFILLIYVKKRHLLISLKGSLKHSVHDLHHSKLFQHRFSFLSLITASNIMDFTQLASEVFDEHHLNSPCERQ